MTPIDLAGKVSATRDLGCYFVTGTTDYIILLSGRAMEDYDAFLQEHIVPDPLVIMSDTNVVIRPLKMSLAVLVDEPGTDRQGLVT